ncbi:ribokinase [Rathayibacter sp. SD072]|uniref:ribokinase n=1 Tax=Rathayibacter sp. SD072 TaxID=2781731 RepID=UPI001A97873C|nr:ribokinase [Rathayibacter sp. SD072]MBO0985507.1 ribokinase [Rathayibacter sp. SD072]
MTENAILVVGSINYDLIVTQQRLPRRGETLVASGLRGDFGGKGANQAVQAARLGASVRFVGAAGTDDYGRRCTENLEQAGVSCRLLRTAAPTGLGIVHVVGHGEVHATIVEGANGEVDAAWVEASREAFDGAAAVVLQNEIPDSANARAVELAASVGVPVFYNAAPARPVPRGFIGSCAWLIVNEDEAAAYLERDLGDAHDDDAMRGAVQELRSWGADVVLTLGSRGCYVAAGREVEFVPAVATLAVDTTGAGDSFIGAFTAAIVDGSGPFDAARTAARVASLTVGGIGAQSSMPTREALQSEVLRQAPADPGPRRAG